MATVTFKLTDFGLQPLAAYQPVMLFTADEPAVTIDGGVLSTRPVSAIPAADGSGTVDLAASIDTTPETKYSLRVEWLDETAGLPGMDVLKGLVVPPGTNSITDLTSIPVSRWWVELPDPNNPSMPLGLADPGPNTWWLDTSTGDLKEWV